jgi:Hemerythrin HHE cation binding domain
MRRSCTSLAAYARRSTPATPTRRGVRLPPLKALLDHHTRREESGVFVQLRRADVDGRYVDRFEREHQELDQLLADCGEPNWPRQVELLIRLLGEHIAREESDLFPAAHQLLRPDQWDAVDAADATTPPPEGTR